MFKNVIFKSILFSNKKEKRRNKHLINYILEVLKLFKIHDLFIIKENMMQLWNCDFYLLFCLLR